MDPDNMNEGEFIVEKILDERIKRGRKEYLIKWQGFPNSENSWEPEDHIVYGTEELLAQFHAERESNRVKTRRGRKRAAAPTPSKKRTASGLATPSKKPQVLERRRSSRKAAAAANEVFGAAPTRRITRSRSTTTDEDGETSVRSTRASKKSKVQTKKAAPSRKRGPTVNIELVEELQSQSTGTPQKKRGKRTSLDVLEELERKEHEEALKKAEEDKRQEERDVAMRQQQESLAAASAALDAYRNRPAPEPVEEEIVEPEPEPEPVSVPLHEPVSVPLHEPVSVPLHEPVSAPLHEPVSKPLDEPVYESVVAEEEDEWIEEEYFEEVDDPEGYFELAADTPVVTSVKAPVVHEPASVIQPDSAPAPVMQPDTAPAPVIQTNTTSEPIHHPVPTVAEEPEVNTLIIIPALFAHLACAIIAAFVLATGFNPKLCGELNEHLVPACQNTAQQSPFLRTLIACWFCMFGDKLAGDALDRVFSDSVPTQFSIIKFLSSALLCLFVNTQVDGLSTAQSTGLATLLWACCAVSQMIGYYEEMGDTQRFRNFAGLVILGLFVFCGAGIYGDKFVEHLGDALPLLFGHRALAAFSDLCTNEGMKMVGSILYYSSFLVMFYGIPVLSFRFCSADPVSSAMVIGVLISDLFLAVIQTYFD